MKPFIAILCAFITLPAAAQEHDMAEAREHLKKHHGGQTFTYVELEHLEYRSNEGDPLFLWDTQGWFGGDTNKLWLKSEGEYDFKTDEFEEAEFQALWSRAIGGYWDLQAGIRYDFLPGNDRTFAVIGVEGLAPYLFEVDAALFISDDGDVSARIESEYELLLTQRLILQPRAELGFEFQDVPMYQLGSGLSSAELGARLRYEFNRQAAPYVGISWERAIGRTADFVRMSGEGPSSVSFVAGLRVWF